MEKQIIGTGMQALRVGQGEGEWHVDRIRYCFQTDPHTHTHVFFYWWMGKYAFLGPRALTSTETQNLDILHTKAVFLFKKFNRTIQLCFQARPIQRAILQMPQ